MRYEYKAKAKVNLSLDVLRRRENGYHDVKMIMQTVNLYDDLIVEDAESGINLEVTTIEGVEIPCDESNLAYKAAKLLMDEFDVKKGVKITINKHIPVAAGMAGGSTDCANTLKGVNELFKLGLSDKELMERGVKLGADVPYCIMGKTALSEGIGEVLTPIENMPQCKILIAKPPINVSTKYVYENLHVETIKDHPDVDGMVEKIKEGDLAGVCSYMENILETVTVKEYPVINELKSFMKENGAINSIMSGSGPTVFGLYDDEKKAKEAYEKLLLKGITKEVYLTDLDI